MLDATQLLEQVFRKYSECHSYYDQGFVRSERTGVQLEFRTHFVRPNFFRIDFTEGDHKSVIWFDGLQAYSEHSFNRAIQLEEHFGEELLASAGISKGATLIIPPLLLSSRMRLRSRIINLRNPRLVEKVNLRNEDCYRILATLSNTDDVELVISIDSFLLRTLNEQIQISASESQALNSVALQGGLLHGIFPWNSFLWKIWLARILPWNSKDVWYNIEYQFYDAKFDEELDFAIFRIPSSAI